jgi:hypothetical protein
MSGAPQPDPKALKAALAERLPDVLRAIIGEPNRHLSTRRDWRFRSKGSLSVVMTGPDAGLWFDHEAGEGGDMLDLLMRDRGVTFPQALALAADLAGAILPAAVPDAEPGLVLRSSAENSALAERIWRESVDPRGTLVEAYLASRNIRLPDHVAGATIRSHPSLWRPSGERAPGMVALFRNIHTNEPQAIHRTFLAADGTKLEKKMLGPALEGAIKLDPDEEVANGLVAGEGIETCLSGAQIGFRPTWALGSAGALGRFPVLAGVHGLTILAEDDEANARAVRACAERWHVARREVIIARDLQGGDLNDTVRRAA